MAQITSTPTTTGLRIPSGVVRHWKRLTNRGHHLEHRIVHLFVALLLAIQLASFLSMRYAIDQAAQRSLHEEVEVGARVLERLLLHQGQQLQEAAKVLAADFGFRDAVASQDRKTILSALENHAARYKTSRMMLVGLDGKVLADSAATQRASRAFPHPDLMQTDVGIERGPSIRVIDGMPYQVVVMPVKAPLTIAWVALSLAIDDAMASDLARLVNAGVAFVVQEQGSARVVATTLSEAVHKGVIGPLLAMVREGRTEARIEGIGSTYEVLLKRLDDSGGRKVNAILLRATEEALLPYRVLEVVALVLTAIAVALTLYGSIRIARRITGPLVKLDAAAREIARGDYDVRVEASGENEVDNLSRSLKQMAYGLQEREFMRARFGRVREQRDDLARLSQALAEEATRDPLTGLTNRRTLELHLAGWDAEARQMAVLMVDIDQLKDINERNSWAVGDRVLRAVAEITRAACRPADLAARYQGDALVLAIANPDPGSAIAIASRLARSVASHPWHEIARDLVVTVSIGIANAKKGVEASEAVRRADTALHAAKRAGPNQVRSATGTFVVV